jgi:hypothetical protein
MAPRIWAMKMRMARIHVMAPMSTMPKVTAGLNRPGSESVRRRTEGARETQTATDAEEHPGIDSQAEPKGQRDVEERASIRDLTKTSISRSGTCSGGVGDLGRTEREEEEED